MRQRILTDREHQHIQKWLKGEKTKGKFHEMLKYRSKKFLPKLSEDLELVKKFIKTN
jgi:glutaredoxin 2